MPKKFQYVAMLYQQELANSCMSESQRLGLEFEEEIRLDKENFISMNLLTHKLVFSALITPGASPNHLLA